MTETIDTLRAKNPDLDVRPLDHPSFARFGRLLQGIELGPIQAAARGMIGPAQAVVYEAQSKILEQQAPFKKAVEKRVYGDMPVELGICYGRNSRLGGLEYHKGSETIVTVNDVLLILGEYADIRWEPSPSYDASKVRVYYAPQGSLIEFYPWCLHFAPLQVYEQEPFCTVVVLPLYTNWALEEKPEPSGEGRLLFARNKWLLAHPEEEDLVGKGAFPGIRGVNVRVNLV